MAQEKISSFLLSMVAVWTFLPISILPLLIVLLVGTDIGTTMKQPPTGKKAGIAAFAEKCA